MYHTNGHFLVKTAEGGIMGKVRELQEEGRLQTIPGGELVSKLKKEVWGGDHVIITVDAVTMQMMAQEFSITGRTVKPNEF